MANGLELSLLDTIIGALSATECGPQSAGLDLDEKEYRIVGEVPMAVRNLHNLGLSYSKEQGALFKEAGDNEVALEVIKPQLLALKKKFDVVDKLRWALLEDAFPTTADDVTGLAIMKGWQAAHHLSQPDDVPPELREIMEMLEGGEVHIMIAGFGGPRTRH